MVLAEEGRQWFQEACHPLVGSGGIREQVGGSMPLGAGLAKVLN